MSSMQKVLAYDDMAAVTASDATDDPAGPFAGLLVTVAGNIKITTYAGHDVGPFAVVAGQELHVTTRRVWSAGKTATVFGLLSPIVRQGT